MVTDGYHDTVTFNSAPKPGHKIIAYLNVPARTTIFHATHISVDDLEAATDYSVNEYAVSPVGRSDSGILTITTFDAQAPSTENTKT